MNLATIPKGVIWFFLVWLIGGMACGIISAWAVMWYTPYGNWLSPIAMGAGMVLWFALCRMILKTRILLPTSTSSGKSE